MRALEPPPAAGSDIASAQAIVVLGGGVIERSPEYGEAVVGSESLVRLRYAARLARETRIPVLVSAGNPYGEVPEAEAMARALKTDFAVEARWIEKGSATTAANAVLSYAMLAPEGRTRIALVTTAWHMPRAARAFRGAGFDVVPAPTAYLPPRDWLALDFVPSSEGLRLTRIALWELLGMAWYALRGVVDPRQNASS